MITLFLLSALVSLSSSSVFDEGWNKGLSSPNIFYRIIASSLFENCTEIRETLGLKQSQISHIQTNKLSLELWYRSNVNNAQGKMENAENQVFEIKKEVFELAQNHQDLLNSANFRKNLPVTIFIHGFHSSSKSEEPRGVAGTLVFRKNTNVLVLDSSKLISTIYVRSTYYSSFIGNELGEYLTTLNKMGLNSESIHIIGHSLGAQIAGFIGKTFKKLTGLKVRRITGLDPAGPCFFEENPDMRLSKGDAEFVDIIHTNSGIYGYVNPIGDLDFYPNGGQEQPGCLVSSCSHERSWKLFAESITNPNYFLAVECRSKIKFEAGKCNGNRIIKMGYEADYKTKGVFYLKTNSHPPYGLGYQGTKAEKPVIGAIGSFLKNVRSF